MLRPPVSPALVAAKPFVALVLVLASVPVEAQETPPADPPAVPLHLAAVRGHLDAIRKHVAAGSDLDQLDAWGSTPLIGATTFGRTAAVRTLIEAGADLTIPNVDGSTPLHVAAFLGWSRSAGWWS